MIKKIDLYEGNELFLFNHKVFNNLDKKIIAKSCLYNKKNLVFLVNLIKRSQALPDGIYGLFRSKKNF